MRRKVSFSSAGRSPTTGSAPAEGVVAVSSPNTGHGESPNKKAANKSRRILAHGWLGLGWTQRIDLGKCAKRLLAASQFFQSHAEMVPGANISRGPITSPL